LPTLQSVYEAVNFLKTKDRKVAIIADGGAKHYGDIAKALTFGATALMSGSWFASCLDSPAKMVDGKKIYRGSTSFELKGENKHIEGRTLTLDGGFTYAERMEEISQALKSAISYAGGKDLSAFKSVEWGKVF
jgi:GMP reductase